MKILNRLDSKKKGLLRTEVIMLIIAAIWFIPIYYLIVTTLKTPQDATAHPLGLPNSIQFENYVEAWTRMKYLRALGNTLLITSGSVFLVALLGSLAGYALARNKTPLSNSLFLLFLCGLMVPFQMNIVSLYRIIKNLGLMNSLLGVILVDTAINMPQCVFLCKEFVASSVPIELEEAAMIDGCPVPGIFFRLVIPLLKPVISTVVIIVTLNVWNEFLNPLLFLQSRANDVILQEVSRNIGQFSTDWTAMFPMLMLGVAPLMVFYVFMQKYIIGGVTAGAVKG